MGLLPAGLHSGMESPLLDLTAGCQAKLLQPPWGNRHLLKVKVSGKNDSFKCKLQIIMGNVMQIAIEALAVFYFDFIFAFLSWTALSKVAAGDTLNTVSPFGYGTNIVHSRSTGVEAKETGEAPSYPHRRVFLRTEI